jgi:hypothetical protein
MERNKSHKPDLEQIRSNWNKTLALFEKKEWSSAVIRAAITIEVAANLVIREELESKRQLESDFVDHLLIWANGIQGKFTRLILPVIKNTERFATFKKIQEQVSYISEERNSVVHSGISKQRRTAERVVTIAREIIETLVCEYHRSFELRAVRGRQEKKISRKKRGIKQYSLFSADPPSAE